MKLFRCQSCGNAVYFENSNCVDCGHLLGFVPEAGLLSAVERKDDAGIALGVPERRYFFCENASKGVCNWLVDAADDSPYCLSCRHTRMVPNLEAPENLVAWARIEQAKRHLFYSLLKWRLPTPTRLQDERNGLAFDFLADRQTSHGVEPILTGHDNGLITLNIAEADDAQRESRRIAMNEPYRTLLGHFRHEIGHYYWDVLVRDGGRIDECRAIFGDESADYAAALQTHYQYGPPGDWMTHFISTYATCHPWEDFAETWAHYMHIVDTLETAGSFGIQVKPRHVQDRSLQTAVDFNPYRRGSIDDLISAWVPVTVALNSLNRSLGQPDIYPFVLSAPVTRKLGFVHDLVRAAACAGTTRQAA